MAADENGAAWPDRGEGRIRPFRHDRLYPAPVFMLERLPFPFGSRSWMTGGSCDDDAGEVT